MMSRQFYTKSPKKGGDTTAIRIDVNSYIPSTAQWILIIGFLIGALGLATQTFSLTTQESAIVLFVVGVLTLLLKIFTTQPIE